MIYALALIKNYQMLNLQVGVKVILPADIFKLRKIVVQLMIKSWQEDKL
jgi:hypothetical protein